VFSLRLLPVGRVVVVGSPALVHAVLTGSSDRFRAGAATARLLPFLGACSPLLLDGDEHRTQRRRLLRAFSAHGAAGDRPAIEAIVRRHVERWPRGRPFTSLPATRALAFEVVVRRAIGLVDVELDDLERRLQRLLNGQAKLAVWGSTHSRPRLGLDPQAVLERRLAALDAVLTAGMDGRIEVAACSPRWRVTATSLRSRSLRRCTSCERSRSSATRPPVQQRPGCFSCWLTTPPRPSRHATPR